jgi:hypothetical protein
MKTKKNNSEITETSETFDCDPYQGVTAMVCTVRKEGYEVVKVDRKGTKATVTYRKITA